MNLKVKRAGGRAESYHVRGGHQDELLSSLSVLFFKQARVER